MKMEQSHSDILDNFKAGKLEQADLDKLAEIAAEIAPQFK
jgi:hypothetical protein